MSNYEDRLNILRAQARQVAEIMGDLPVDVWAGPELRLRCLGVFAYTRTVLEASSAELLSDGTFHAIASAIAQFEGNPSLGAQNADAWSSILIDAITLLPAARDRDVEQAVKDAAANFQRSAQQRLQALKEEYGGTKAEVSEIREAIEERKAELGTAIDTRKAEVESQIATLQIAFESKLLEFEQQLEAEQNALGKMRTRQTASFEQEQQQREVRATERLEATEAALDQLQANATKEVEQRIAEIRRMESESAQLVGAIGLAGTAERYGEEVAQQRRVADNWRRATVIFGLLAIVGVLLSAHETHPDAGPLIGKLGFSLVLGGLATYAARQSANHRHRQDRARDLQLELTAFSPFIEPLSAEQQEEERVIMTRKTFGKTTTATKQEEEPGPTPLSFALRRKEKEAAEEAA